MKKIIKIAVLSLLLVSCATGERIIANRVGIYNSSSSVINIELGETGRPLEKITIPKGETWLSPNFHANPVIKVKTGNQTVIYTLSKSNYYMIYWNESDRRWDVQKTTDR
ncbi:hypothetical protein [Algoriphagus terrigena]|uniref:hypothetical protein n=1 Tax=Algoriphagus terrigena TaxID=344884 RepID=UPI0004794126|nr:hypothetical protein [Algoriphagus terrigena]